ncbi:amino acid permease [bacterium]|nr:amino acid permease [bacterium]
MEVGTGNFISNILKRKNSSEIIETSSNAEIKKTLGLFNLVMLGVGAIFGAGLYTIIGVATAGSGATLGAGPAVCISMFIAVIASVFSALCYCELATMIPVAGSAYIYTYATLGEFVAWLVGWLLILEYIIGSIAGAIAWNGYLFQFLKGFDKYLPHYITNPPIWLITDYNTLMKQSADVINSVPHIFNIPFSINLPAILFVILMVWCITRGTKESTMVTTIMVGVKICIALIFIFTGIFYVRPENWVPFAPNGFSGIAMGAFTIFFAYVGFDAIATVSEECKKPKRDVPLAIILSLVICTIVYIAVALVLTGVMPLNEINIEAPIAYALHYIGQSKIAGLVSLGALAAMTSVNLVMTIGGSRILYAMSRDNFLPPYFKFLSKRTNTPNRITWVIGLVIIIGILTTDLTIAAELCNLGTFFSLIIICMAIPILRKTEPDIKRSFKVPLSPLIPILGVLICLGLCIQSFLSGSKSTPIFIGYMVVGIVFYFAYSYRKIRQSENNDKEQNS